MNKNICYIIISLSYIYINIYSRIIKLKLSRMILLLLISQQLFILKIIYLLNKIFSHYNTYKCFLYLPLVYLNFTVISSTNQIVLNFNNLFNLYKYFLYFFNSNMFLLIDYLYNYFLAHIEHLIYFKTRYSNF